LVVLNVTKSHDLKTFSCFILLSITETQVAKWEQTEPTNDIEKHVFHLINRLLIQACVLWSFHGHKGKLELFKFMTFQDHQHDLSRPNHQVRQSILSCFVIRHPIRLALNLGSFVPGKIIRFKEGDFDFFRAWKQIFDLHGEAHRK